MSWLLGLASGLGRKLWGYALAAAVVGAILLKAYSKGRTDERMGQAASSLENLKTRNRTDEEVGALDDAALRDALSGWVQHDGR